VRLARPPVELVALGLIMLLAGGLRLVSLGAVPVDPFYDAAVRSMALSAHNFFFGAYEPGGTLAIDKPPLDMWLQVISTQLFGFGSVSLKLPEALCGTLAVAVLYDAVRRVLGPLAALGSAVALAVLPIAVLSSRSDTMDSVAMFLNVVALWLVVRFALERRERWLYLAAATLGLAFNVKIFQGVVCLPALGLLALLAAGRERLVRRSVIAAVVFVAVSLSWLTATLFFPASQRPYAIGSTNGSAWDATFVYNGYDRVFGAATQTLLNAQGAAVLKPANNSEAARAQVAIAAPGPLRLFLHDDPLSGLRIGFVLLGSLLLGVPALVRLCRARGPDARAQRALAGGLLAWLATGLVLLSAMSRLHPRYAEAFTPAVAAAAGIGLAWALRAPQRRIAVPLAALAFAAYSAWLLGAGNATALLTALAAAGAIGAALLPGLPRREWLAGMALAICAFALPLRIAVGLVQDHEYDSGIAGVFAPRELDAISNYIAARRDGARYEFVVADPSTVGDLIIHDAQPILSLTSYNQHELLALGRLAALVREGQVRFAYIGGPCIPGDKLELPRCSPGAAWVRAHGIDISRTVGLPRSDVLYFLPR